MMRGEAMKYDVIIVGAGIAGLTAAIYLRRAEKSVLVLESKVCGGQIVNNFSVENWPGETKISGADLMEKVRKQAVGLGTEIKFEGVKDVLKDAEDFAVVTEENRYAAKTVILATGAESRKLSIPGEDEFAGRGVSYCATCDGALYKNKIVAMIGGGNTALEGALYLADIAKKVYLVHLYDEFKGEIVTVKKLKQRENVEFVLGYTSKTVEGGDRVENLKIVPSDKVAGVTDERDLAVDGVFVAIGQVPTTKEFSNLVKMDDRGYIVAGEDCVTSCEGIFVAGDCRTKSVRQLVTAAADGAVAAEAVNQYLNR
jgi:thioredoxin reductase (NADPH)